MKAASVATGYKHLIELKVLTTLTAITEKCLKSFHLILIRSYFWRWRGPLLHIQNNLAFCCKNSRQDNTFVEFC